jgi:arylformamidase
MIKILEVRMRIYDVSLPVSSGLPVWPGDPPIQIERITRIEDGAPANVTAMNAGVHIGTHVDAPYHFLGGSAPTVEQLSLKMLTGRAYVLHLPDEVDLITAAVLKQIEFPPRLRRVLFRTRNSKEWARLPAPFNPEFVALSADGAQYLIERGVRLVGVDYLSVAPYSDPVPTHQVLLRAGVVIVEGLDLSQVPQGRYTLYCLPLKLAGSDGAPARAILVGA